MLTVIEATGNVGTAGIEIADLAPGTEKGSDLEVQSAANVEGAGITGVIGGDMALAEVNDSTARD